jgi:transposase
MCMDKETAEKLYDSGKETVVQLLLKLDAKVDELTEKVARLSKNSSTSSKPPSSDIVKPNRTERRRNQKEKRKKGGQENHPRWERQAFSPDEVTPIDHPLKSCPMCNGPVFLDLKQPVKILQQIEVITPVVEKLEHRAYAYWCPHCKCFHYASFPESVEKEGLFKAHISTTVCFLKYVGSMSYSAIKKYLQDVMKIRVSKGYLAKVVHKGAQSLESSYDELLHFIPMQKVINADETGHKENGNKFWTWVFRTSLHAVFKIDQSRGSEVLISVLGKEFDGVLGCDYFSAYRKYMRTFDVKLQFCLAHLIRDVKFLTEYPDPKVKDYGNRLLDSLRNLFHTIHLKDTMSERDFQISLQLLRDEIILVATINVPAAKVAQNMAWRFEMHGAAYFTFITTPDLEPTNNCAEQAIRFVVQYRHISQGTRSENGRIACERFWTVIATCAMQGRSAFDFIKESITAFVNKTNPPTLILSTNTA